MRTVIAIIVSFVVWTALRFGTVGIVSGAIPEAFDEAGTPTNALASWIVLLSTLPISVVSG